MPTLRGDIAGIGTPVAINLAKNDTREMVAAVEGKKIYVYSMFLVASATGSVTFKSKTTAITGVIPVQARERITAEPCPTQSRKHLETAADEALNVTLSTDVDLDGWITYEYVD